MTSPATGLTLEALATRLDDLEQENAALPASPPPTEAATVPATLDRLSRRWLLRRGLQAAAASAAAGALLHRDTQIASADNFDSISVQNYAADGGNVIYADNKDYHSATVTAHHLNHGIAIRGDTASDDFPALRIINSGGWYGVEATSAGIAVHAVGATGVGGYSSTEGYEGVYGQFTGTNGYGVLGDGVGTGVQGQGITGLLGKSSAINGNAVFGQAGGAATGVNGASVIGYGVVAKGGMAPLRLIPPTDSSAVGPPTGGGHAIGELYVDYNGALFVNTRTGWKRVTLS